MKFACIEVVGVETIQDEIPGREIAELICNSLGGDGPCERGGYGWEWVFRGENYKALAVLQQYINGWQIPVNVSFLDRVLNRGESVLDDLFSSIEKGLGTIRKKILKFQSDKEFRESDV
jgi:hypothetical protein